MIDGPEPGPEHWLLKTSLLAKKLPPVLPPKKISKPVISGLRKS
jgi:hypothetical protein